MAPAIYLISGANRGIGLGLVTSLISRDNVVIFAGARSPSSAVDLQALAAKYPGKVHIVKLISADKENNEAAVADIKRIAGRLDIVIASAGIGEFYGSTLETPAEQMMNHFDINVVGPLLLFQATYLLLKESSPSPKFIPITSAAGSVQDGTSMPWGAIPYSASKTALNYMARRWHFEFPELTVFPLNPGPVVTDLTDFTKKHVDVSFFTFSTVEECVKNLLNEIDNATRESSGGQFVDRTGERLNW